MESRVAQLRSWLADAGIATSDEALALSVGYLDCFLVANREVNLTSVRDPAEALRIHALDSLLALPEVLAAPPGPMLDLGSGGGFPGVPLAVATGRSTLLLDSVGRKTSAVQACLISTLRGNEAIVAACGRSEEVASRGESDFSVVVARAVAELPALLELARPLLAQGGLLVAMKGAPEPSEIERALQAAEILGMEFGTCRRYSLPEGGEARAVYTYRVVGAAGIELPRRPGRATKRPLA